MAFTFGTILRKLGAIEAFLFFLIRNMTYSSSSACACVYGVLIHHGTLELNENSRVLYFSQSLNAQS